MNQPKVSIIIPVYNVEKYLRECIESAVNQTFTNIEIICVNDCSTDNSLDILKEYAEKDSRIVLVDKPINEGTMLARKSGIDVAKGEYSIFLDADDYIGLGLCQFLNDELEKEKVDILHFSTGVDAEKSGINAKGLIAKLDPFERFLGKDEILHYAYIDRKFASQLCCKAFNTQICKKAWNYLPKEHCHVGEDVFSFFVIACFANNYKGIKTSQFYIYRYGVGVSNLKTLSLDKFELFCKMSNWYRYAIDILDKILSTDIQRAAAKKMAERLFDDCSEMYDTRIEYKDKSGATDLMAKYWYDIPVEDSAWIKNTGFSKEYFLKQFDIKEYESDYNLNNAVEVGVSVVIIADNNIDILKNCIENVVHQTYRNIEIICVNNGSIDDSVSVIESLMATDNRIRLINLKRREEAFAKQKALDTAKGKYIYFMSDITLLKDDAIEKMYNLAVDYNADIVTECVFNENQSTTTAREIFEYVSVNIDKFNLDYFLINRLFWVNKGIKFENSLKHHEKLLMLDLIMSADKIVCLEKYIKRVSNEVALQNNASEFIECFKEYTMITSKIILSDINQYNDFIETIIEKLYQKCIDIYMGLSFNESRKVDKYLADEFKPLFFSIRELRNTKNTLEYKVGNKIKRLFRLK